MTRQKDFRQNDFRQNDIRQIDMVSPALSANIRLWLK